MPAPAPKTDKWTARENEQGKDGKLGIVLIVTGLVEVSSTNKTPVLKEASGGGGQGKTLALDLTIETSGEGAQVPVWKRATLSKDVSANHYDNVEIRWEGKTIATVKVLNDDEHHQHLTALTRAANKAHANDKPPTPAKPKGRAAPGTQVHPEPKRPAAKKPAAKKTAAKKRPAAAKKRAPAAKKRAAAAKKRTPAKKRAGAKKRSTANKLFSAARKWLSGGKKRPSAAKKRSSGAKKRASGAKKRASGAKKKRSPSRRR